jgi:hypothetical protein
VTNKESKSPRKKEASAFDRGIKVQENPPEVATGNGNAQARKLPPGKYPGFGHLKNQPGVYRCKLFFQTVKRDPQHADFKGVLPLSGSKASVLIWVHADGTLGLRLEKIEDRRKGQLRGGVAK